MVELFTHRRGRPVTWQEETILRQFQQTLSHGIQMGREKIGRDGFSDRSGKEGVTDKTDWLRPAIHPIADAALCMARRHKTMDREPSD